MKILHHRLGLLVTAILTALAVLVVTALPAGAVTSPFTWGSPTSEQWCPTYHGYNGCNNSQSSSQYIVSFSPSQVSVNRLGYVSLTMNSAETTSGAFNTEDTPSPLETFSAPLTISSQVDLPCSGSPAEIDNWPAVWLTTTGTWPNGGEFDLVEGLGGQAEWHYHYLNASGDDAAVGGAYTGVGGAFPCGSNGTGGAYTYKVHIYKNSQGYTEADFYAAGHLAGQVAETCTSPCISIGVPVATGPWYMVYDYALDNTNSGPHAGNVSMQVRSFSYSAS